MIENEGGWRSPKISELWNWVTRRMVKCGHSCPQSLAAKRTALQCIQVSTAGLSFTCGPLFMFWACRPFGSTGCISDLLRPYHLWVLGGVASLTVMGMSGSLAPPSGLQSSLRAWQGETPSTLFRYSKHSPVCVSGITNPHPHKADCLDKDSSSLVGQGRNLIGDNRS